MNMGQAQQNLLSLLFPTAGQNSASQPGCASVSVAGGSPPVVSLSPPPLDGSPRRDRGRLQKRAEGRGEVDDDWIVGSGVGVGLEEGGVVSDVLADAILKRPESIRMRRTNASSNANSNMGESGNENENDNGNEQRNENENTNENADVNANDNGNVNRNEEASVKPSPDSPQAEFTFPSISNVGNVGAWNNVDNSHANGTVVAEITRDGWYVDVSAARVDTVTEDREEGTQGHREREGEW
jgi:hypothetical protein